MKLTLSIFLGIALATELGAASDSTWIYRGFRCDMSALAGNSLESEVSAAVHEQIDIVCAVGLSPRVLGFFRSVPLIVLTAIGETPASYVEGKRVELSVSVVAYLHRPVLLHEFLHSYHDQEVMDGTRNAEILTYYERAKQKGTYSPRSHMMENVGEFFACAATTYLAGYTGQEPYFREKLQSSQPQFFEYLKRAFGPDSGRYEGSREGPDQQRIEKLKRPNPESSVSP